MSLSAVMVFVLAQAASAAPAPPPARPPRLPTRSQMEAQVKSRFQKVDANGDGKIDRAEASKAHAAALAAREERRRKRLATAFARLDANKDGTLSRQEFEVISSPQAVAKEAWFDANDIDKDGSVILNEALAKAQRAFEAIDTNANGVISSEELRASRRQRQASSK